MSRSVFHVTPQVNVEAILRDGLHGGWGDDGFGVYVFSSLAAAEEYADRGGWDGSHKPENLAIVQIEANEHDLQEVIPHPEWPDPESYDDVMMMPLDEASDIAWKPATMTVLSSLNTGTRYHSMMAYPSVGIAEVSHVGQLDRGSRSARSSLEAFMLSVSVNPEEWSAIARCPGPVWTLSCPQARWLDPLAMTDVEEAAMMEWGQEAGLVAPDEIWRAWFFDDEMDGWCYGTFASREAAEREVDGDLYDPECPSESGALIESLQGCSLTEEAMRRLERWHSPLEAREGLVILWAQDVLLPQNPDLVGIWWDEELNPASLSCPRGGIFPERIALFEITDEMGRSPSGEIFTGFHPEPVSGPSL